MQASQNTHQHSFDVVASLRDGFERMSAVAVERMTADASVRLHT
jgi:hypothetical protein